MDSYNHQSEACSAPGITSLEAIAQSLTVDEIDCLTGLARFTANCPDWGPLVRSLFKKGLIAQSDLEFGLTADGRMALSIVRRSRGLRPAG